MIYAVTHKTTIRYSGLVSVAQFNVRLRPAPWPGQNLRDFRLTVDPLPWTRQDEPGSYVVNQSRLTMRDPIAELTIESRFTAEVLPSPVDHATIASPTVADVRARALTLPDLTAWGPASYLFASPIASPAPEIAGWARGLIADDMPVLAAGQALMHAIHGEFHYDSDATKTDTPPVDAFRKRHGVCQDFAHVMIVALRSLGIPAGYVSGFLRTIPPPGKERLEGADAMHAWVRVWCGTTGGWLELDPTNNIPAGTDHIVVGHGRDYGDVAPVIGVLKSYGSQTTKQAVDVIPVA